MPRAKRPLRVEVRNPILTIIIRAEFNLTSNDGSIEEKIQEALDALNEYGSADIASRSVSGEPIK